MSESHILTSVRLAATRLGARLFRNNCGVARDARSGRPVRFGLCPGSHDLIGWTPVTIRPEHVGTVVAVFTGVEVKTARTATTDKQHAFHAAVARAGGISIVARSESDYQDAISRITTGDPTC